MAASVGMKRRPDSDAVSLGFGVPAIRSRPTRADPFEELMASRVRRPRGYAAQLFKRCFLTLLLNASLAGEEGPERHGGGARFQNCSAELASAAGAFIDGGRLFHGPGRDEVFALVRPASSAPRCPLCRASAGRPPLLACPHLPAAAPGWRAGPPARAIGAPRSSARRAVSRTTPCPRTGPSALTATTPRGPHGAGDVQEALLDVPS